MVHTDFVPRLVMIAALLAVSLIARPTLAQQSGAERVINTTDHPLLQSFRWRAPMMLQPARSNEGLLETAFVAGRVDLPTALLLRGQLLAAEPEYWEAWLADRAALAALRAAVGETPAELQSEF